MKSSMPCFRTLVFSLLLVTPYTVAAEQDNIEVDTNGDYIITYKSYLGWQKVKWIPATKINPEVMAVVRTSVSSPNQHSYRYTIQNRQDSRQYLVGLNFHASNVLSADTVQPVGWSGGAVLDHATGSGFIVGWFFRRSSSIRESGIKQGTSLDGFELISKDLPGIGTIRLGGARPGGQSFPDEGPNADDNPTIIKEFNRIIDHDYVTRLAAVPRIMVPDPFDAATVLTGLKTHLRDDLVPMKLVEPVFAERFNGLLDAAIDAARRNNIAGLRDHLKQLRLMLKGFGEPGETDHTANIPEDQINTKRWPHPVARLAARVLDYDLAYIEKRI